MRKALLVIITLLSLCGSAGAQGWTSALNGNVTLSGSAALFPVGTDSRPSIASQQVTNTGIRFPTAGTQISFLLSGTRYLLLDAAGFVVGANYVNFGTTSGTTGYGLRNNGGQIEYKNSGGAWTAFVTGGANAAAKYVLQTADASVPNAQVLGSLASGLLGVTTTVGVVSSVNTSAQVAANLSDETGTGALVFASSPTLAGTIAGTYTLGGTPTLPAVSSTNYPATTSAQLRGVLSDEVGTGAAVFVGGYGFGAYVGKSATFTVDSTMGFVACDATAGAVTANLPTAVLAGSGREYTLKKIDATANACIWDGNGAEPIDGAATFSITTQYNSITIISDGVGNWYIK